MPTPAVLPPVQRFILNPGHGLNNTGIGIYDPGATSAYGKEAEIVATVVDEVVGSYIAAPQNIPYTILETPDCGPQCVPKHPLVRVSRKLRAPSTHLGYVIDWINQNALRNSDGKAVGDYVVSVHMNEADDPAASGSLVVYGVNAGATRAAEAAAVAAAVSQVLGLPNRGAAPETTSPHCHLGIVHDTDPPALLIELGFVSNQCDVDAVKKKGDIAVRAAIQTIADMRRPQ